MRSLTRRHAAAAVPLIAAFAFLAVWRSSRPVEPRAETRTAAVSRDLTRWTTAGDSVIHEVVDWTGRGSRDFVATPVLELGKDENFDGIAGAWITPGSGLGVIDGSLRIRIYTSEGDLLATSGGPGAGPGEFRQVSRAIRADESVVAWDPSLRRISYWSLYGDHQGEMHPTSESLARYPGLVLLGIRPDGVLLFGGQGLNNEVGLYHTWSEYMWYDPRDNTASALGLYPEREWFGLLNAPGLPGGYGMVTPLFFRSTSVAVDSLSYLVMYNGEQRYRVYDDAGTLLHTVGNFGRAPIDERLIRIAKDSALADIPSSFVKGMRSLLEAMPVRDSTPTAGTWRLDAGPGSFLYVDEQRRVWVLEYQLPGSSSAVWRVYTRGGGAPGRVVFPREVSALLDSTGDTVLGLWRDEIGIEHLTLYSLGTK